MYKKYLAIIISLVIIVGGFIKINMYNTVALSPLGNTDDNFKMVSSEFGEDFSEFIKDKSPVKIYLGEENDNEAKVNVYGKDINLTKENPFLVVIKPAVDFVKNTFSTIVDKFNKNTQNNNEIINSNDINNSEDNKNNVDSTDSTNSNIDNIVDDFINSQNNETTNGE